MKIITRQNYQSVSVFKKGIYIYIYIYVCVCVCVCVWIVDMHTTD